MNQQNSFINSITEKLNAIEQIVNQNDLKSFLGTENSELFFTASKYVSSRLRQSLPNLISEQELSQINVEVDACLSQLNDAINNKNIQTVYTSKNNLLSATLKARTLPTFIPDNEYNHVTQISKFQEISKTAIAELTNTIGKLRSDLENIEKTINTKNQQLIAIETKIQNKQNEIDNAFSTYKTEFANIKSTISSDIEIDRKEFKTQFQDDRVAFTKADLEQKDLLKKEFEEWSDKIADDAKNIVDTLLQKLNDAKQILSAIGDVGVSGNFRITANKHRSDANLFRWIALGFMGGMAALLIWVICDLSTGTINWEMTIIRIVAASILSYPAAYASRESSKHRKLETYNRNMELELAAIGPFIELLPEEKKELIKEKMVDRFFGNGDHASDDSKEEKEDISINGLEKILKAVASILKK